MSICLSKRNGPEGDDIHSRNSRKNEARYVAAERLWDTPQSSLKTHQALLSRVNAEKLSDLRVLDGDARVWALTRPFLSLSGCDTVLLKPG